MDIQRKAFEESNNVNPDWSFKFDEELQQYIAVDFEMTSQVDEFNEHWDTFRAGWQAAIAQAVPKWISVEDKLPELKEHTWRTALPVNVMIDGYGQYLCYPCQDGNGVFYWADATYYGNDKGEHPIKCDRDTEVLNVTHWMPLPDAPQEPTND